MTPLPDLRLAAADSAQLRRLQAKVDAAGAYPRQVAAAKARFAAKPAPLFRRIRARLAAMCTGNTRCVYCEDSAADEVEHVRPKDLYPGKVFAWPNYVFACGPCNGPKNNKFAVLGRQAGSYRLVDVARRRNDPVARPRAGAAALVDPRHEDPLALLWLDFQTGHYVPNAADGDAAGALRARYSIDVLRLNARSDLVRGRRAAFSGYRARLESWVRNRAGWSAAQRKAFVEEFRTERYRGVWEQMKRRRKELPELDALLAQAPEALKW